MASSLATYRKIQRYVDKALSTQMLGMNAALRRRGDKDYPCKVVIAEFSPIERMGGLINPLDVKAIVSAKGLAITPVQDTDRLVTFVPGTNPPQEDATYQMTARPAPLAPAGVILFWQLTVRKQ